MKGFELLWLIIAAMHLFLGFVVAASLQQAARRGTAAASTLYVILALATVIWITRSVLWQQ